MNINPIFVVSVFFGLLLTITVLVVAGVNAGKAGRGKGLVWLGAVAIALTGLGPIVQAFGGWLAYRLGGYAAYQPVLVLLNALVLLLTVVGAISLVFAVGMAGRGAAGGGPVPPAPAPGPHA